MMHFSKIISSVFFLYLSFISVGQLTPIGNSGNSTTNYTNGAANNPIYIWCADGLSNNTASLTANAPSGVGPYTFNWFYHDQSNFSWTPYFTETGMSSTMLNLPSDGYRVQIYDAGNNLVGCYIAWVWNMNSDVNANNTPTACNGSNLSGSVNVNGSFTYYNPPPPESLINSSTQINVCFSATHTWVSDLAFYLVGPAACGSPIILLSPNPGAIGQGTVCNSGDNVNNLCFTTSPAGNLNVCAPAPATLSGTYSSYGPSNTPINWNPLFGCNAAEGGWRVQIYDCIGADVGALTNASITFSNLTSICGSPSSISYTSGAINSAINDNSCSAASASIFQVPITPNLTTPITINASTTYLWTADQSATIPNASSSLTPGVSNIPNGTTNFTLTATISYGSVVCTNNAVTAFVNTCCTATADAGLNMSFCNVASGQIGTPSMPGMTYSWSPSSGLNDANIAQPTVTVSSPGSTVYTLTVVNVADGGCSATDNVTVTISASPTLTVSPNTSVCPGGCATLTVSGADFYSWSPSPDISDVALATQNVCPTATTTYNVTGYAVGNTVVTNGDFSGGATGFTSDYILNSDTQSESTYFVTTNANNTHPNFVGVDHTTGAGNFLVVNGSGTPNSSVWCQTIPVQPNTDYVFSTWVSTLAVGSPASLQFSINGSNLSTPFIAPSATNVWDEFYTTWNSGASTSATICIVNQNTSTGGNDFGIDDIVFSPVCTSTESVTVTVNSNPVVSAGTYPAACIDAADITLVGTPAGGAFSGTGVTGNSFDPTSGTQTITYNYTDGNGCSNSNTATITVNTLPIVSAGTYPAVCASVVSVPLAGTPAGGAFSGTGVSGNAFNPAVGTSTISYVYTDGNGCANNANTIINVNAIPLSDAGSYPAVCQDAPNVNLVGSPAGGVFTGTGVLSGSFDPSVGTQTVTYTYTDGNGCVNTATASMLVNPLPNINGGADVTVCEGEMVTLNGVNGISYSWNNGGIDGQPFTPSLGSLVYTVTGTDANGCVNTDNVMVNTLPMPIASISADVQIGYPILLVNFTNNSSSASTYVWDFGNGQVVSTGNTNDQFMNYSLPGTYIVQLVAGNGFCVVTDTLHIVVVPLPDPIVYIPNVFTPNGDGSNDTFTIDTDFAESIEIQIFNRWGNVVKEINGLNETWNGMVDSNEASDGVYFFKYTVTGINGEVLNGHGNVTLIR
jgi:gliding motility-associated-like protein